MRTIKKTALFLTILFFFFALFNIVIPISKNWNKYTEKFDIKKSEKKYNNSQYVIPQSKNPISDEDLLSYAGYRYATGINPILINSDHPPLGKYIIGWFTLLTGNNRVVSIFFGLANMILISVIIFFVSGSLFYAALGAFFFSLDTIVIDLIVFSPMLDIIQVFFLLLYFLFFLKWSKNKKAFDLILAGISLGCLSGIKLYFPALLAMFVSIFFMILTRKNLKKIIIYSILIPIINFFVYTISYFKYFLLGHSLREFLGVQKWIFLFWKNNSANVTLYHGNFFKLIMFNQWKISWPIMRYIEYDHWSIFWAVFFLSGIGFSLYFIAERSINFLKKTVQEKNILTDAVTLLSIWIIAFTGYIYFIPIAPRYLILLYLPIYVFIPLMFKLKYFKNNYE